MRGLCPRWSSRLASGPIQPLTVQHFQSEDALMELQCREPHLTVGRNFCVLRYVGRHTQGQQGCAIDKIEICCNL